MKKNIGLSKNLDHFYLGQEASLRRLGEANMQMKEHSHRFIGYPCNGAFKLDAFFSWWSSSVFSKLPFNDVGDPNIESTYSLNTRPYEREVLDFFSRLFGIESCWGFLTAGGTQGNEEGLYIGRESLKPYGSPVLYFSEEAHYSIGMLGRVLGFECRQIGAFPMGQMDEEDLEKQLIPGRPALFSISVGTTFKGAIDDVTLIQKIVERKGIPKAFYHADAALFGGFLPFCEDPQTPELDFRKTPFDSILISGHKFFGSPVPFGIFLTKRQFVDNLKSCYIEYIGSRDVTIPCSRSSLNTLILWWIISNTPIKEFVSQANQIIEGARDLKKKLLERGLQSWLNPFSNTVFFELPSDSLCKAWSIPRSSCRYFGPLGHIVVMQHVTDEVVDLFLAELEESKSLESLSHK